MDASFVATESEVIKSSEKLALTYRMKQKGHDSWLANQHLKRRFGFPLPDMEYEEPVPYPGVIPFAVIARLEQVYLGFDRPDISNLDIDPQEFIQWVLEAQKEIGTDVFPYDEATIRREVRAAAVGGEFQTWMVMLAKEWANKNNNWPRTAGLILESVGLEESNLQSVTEQQKNALQSLHRQLTVVKNSSNVSGFLTQPGVSQEVLQLLAKVHAGWRASRYQNEAMQDIPEGAIDIQSIHRSPATHGALRVLVGLIDKSGADVSSEEIHAVIADFRKRVESNPKIDSLTTYRLLLYCGLALEILIADAQSALELQGIAKSEAKAQRIKVLEEALQKYMTEQVSLDAKPEIIEEILAMIKEHSDVSPT